MTGNITRWEPGRGFGFVGTEQGQEVFVHICEFIVPPECIEVGSLVEFDVVKSPRGLRATRIAVVETEQSDAA